MPGTSTASFSDPSVEPLSTTMVSIG